MYKEQNQNDTTQYLLKIFHSGLPDLKILPWRAKTSVASFLGFSAVFNTCVKHRHFLNKKHGAFPKAYLPITRNRLCLLPSLG
jgi:hypothetical protein